MPCRCTSIEFAFPPPPLVSGFVDIDVLDELVNASQQIFICDFAQHVRNQADCLSVLVYVRDLPSAFAAR